MKIPHGSAAAAIFTIILVSIGCNPLNVDRETIAVAAVSHSVSEPSLNTTPIPRGNRLLGIETTTVPPGLTYEDNMVKAQSMNAQATCMSIQWNQIEPKPKEYADPDFGLSIANLYYPTKNMKLSLIIRSIDTVVTPVPSDLKNTRFDDPKMITRFQAMLDWVFDKIPKLELSSLQIGNEIDLNVISTPSFWSQYATFVKEVVSHVHMTRPGTLVGFTVTHRTAGSNLEANILAAAKTADVIGITYYPLNEDFTVKPSSVVAGDFARIVQAFGTKTIHIAEIGLPTGKANQSSETLQSQFLESVFLAWDIHVDKIPYVSIDRLVDYNHSEAKSMAAEYGIRNNVAFTSFIETLGLQSFAGVDKSAVATLRRLTQERSW